MLAFLGGTGPEGRGLALRLALAGEDIIIGSRDAERAATAAAELTLLIEGIGGVAGAGTIRAGTIGAGSTRAGTIEGADNLAAAARADSAFITVPYEAQRPLLEPLVGSLSGKVVVNVIAPMRFERGRGAIAVPVEAGSAAEEAQLLLPDSPVVAAFQNVSAEELQEPERAMEGDVGGLRRRPAGQDAGDVSGRKDSAPAAGGRRQPGKRQIRRADYAPAGQHQPDL